MPGSFLIRKHSLRPQHLAVPVRIRQLMQDRFQLFSGNLPAGFQTPAGKHFVRVMTMVMMVVMFVAAPALFILIMMVMMMLVTAAAFFILVMMVVVMLMAAPALFILVMMVMVMLVAAPALLVLVMVMVMLMAAPAFLILVMVMVMMAHFFQEFSRHIVGRLLDDLQKLGARQGFDRSGHDGRLGVLLPKKLHALGYLIGVRHIRPA